MHTRKEKKESMAKAASMHARKERKKEVRQAGSKQADQIVLQGMVPSMYQLRAYLLDVIYI